MVHLERLAKPDVLAKNEAKWTEKFIQSGKDRPSSSQYGHQEVKGALALISANKCFYSEVLFSSISEAHIDHYIEVSTDEGKKKAFDWDNLYLAHKDCNVGKSPNSVISASECLNPFIDTDEEIEKHLYFENEMILAKNDSEKGRKTIQKYHLNKEYFNLQRSRVLGKFKDAIILCLQKKLSKENVLQFANSDRPFSLMIRLYLKEKDLL